MKSSRAFVAVLFVLFFSSESFAQCPYGKTVLIWVNGILVSDATKWATSITEIRDKFYQSSSVNRECVLFESFYNQSSGIFGTGLGALIGEGDLGQSVSQLDILQAEQAYVNPTVLDANPKAHQVYMSGALAFQEILSKDDPDLVALNERVLDWWSKGYRVVLVGHSQGNLYTNMVYGFRLSNADGKGKKLPDSNQLAMISIATPASLVWDGRNMYTTHCNDFIQYAPDRFDGIRSALPANVKNSGLGCFAKSVFDSFLNKLSRWQAVFNLMQIGYSYRGHLLETYMVEGSNAQERIYRQIEDSLPDIGCEGDQNCYLKDNFRQIDYGTNWTLTSIDGNSAIDQSSGILRLFSSRGISPDHAPLVPVPGVIRLRSRRVFTGPFIASFFVNNIGGGRSSILLKKINDNSIALALYIDTGPGQNSISEYPVSDSPVLLPMASGLGGWHKITFSKSDGGVGLVLDGARIALTTNRSSTMDGYYLEFDSEGDNQLLVKDLVVIRSVATAVPSSLAVPTINQIKIQGTANANTAFDMKVTASGILTGKIQAWVFDVSACSNGCRHPDGGVIDVTSTGLTLKNVRLNAGEHYLKLRNTDNGGWSNPSDKFIVTQPAYYIFTPPTQSKSVVAGESIVFDTILEGKNNPQSTITFSFTCILSCPAGITYDATTGPISFLTNEKLALSISFIVAATALPGTYDFEYRAVVDSTTLTIRMSLTVTARAIVNPTSNPSPSLVFSSDSQSKSVMVGQIVTFDSTIQARNNSAGSVNLKLTCTGCPAGVTYDYTSGQVTIGANGTIPVQATFNVSQTSVPGTYSFQYEATIGNLIAVTTLTLKIEAMPITSNLQYPSIDSWMVSTTPKAYQPFDLTLFGKNFSSSSQAYVCGSTSDDTCFAVVMNFTNSGKITLPAIQWNAVGTIYVKIINPGGLASGFVILAVTMPQPSLSGWSVNTPPKSYKPFDLTIYGSGFVDGLQGYVCGSIAMSTCFAVVTNFANTNKVVFPAVQWNAVGTIYFKVMNQGGLSSEFMSLVVGP